MRIEKKGNLHPTLRFDCHMCGCVFVAGKGEYTWKQCLDFVIECYARCPNAECRTMVTTVKNNKTLIT